MKIKCTVFLCISPWNRADNGTVDIVSIFLALDACNRYIDYIGSKLVDRSSIPEFKMIEWFREKSLTPADWYEMKYCLIS